MCSSSFNSCAHAGGSLGPWCLVTHSQVTVSSSSPLWVLPSTPRPVCSLYLTAVSESELALQSLWSPPMPPAAPQRAALPPRIPLHHPAFHWCLGRQEHTCCCTHLCCAREQTAHYGLGLLKWMNFWNKGGNWSLELRYTLISLNN